MFEQEAVFVAWYRDPLMAYLIARHFSGGAVGMPDGTYALVVSLSDSRKADLISRGGVIRYSGGEWTTTPSGVPFYASTRHDLVDGVLTRTF